MKEFGFVYVLANSAMPNMIKIGKTTRSTSERAEELSKATGLPTPFIVVYEQLFEDCGEAEVFVHTYLGNKGYRVADNREFFNCPVSIAVKAIALAPNAIDSSRLESVQEEDDFFVGNEPDELDDLHLEDPEPTYPWTDIFNEAEAHYYGHDDCIEDRSEALRLYRQAAKLGSLPAYSCIGDIYENGEGVREDKIKALDFYKEGARKGSATCYWRMGIMFLREENISNSEKCFSLFLKHKPENRSDNQAITDYELHGIFLDCGMEIIHKRKANDQGCQILRGFISDHYSDILSGLEDFKGYSDESGAHRWDSSIEYLNINFS